MHKLGFTLASLLDHICYGNELGRSASALKKARRDLRRSPLLPRILDHLHTTPRTQHKGKNALGAVEPLETWALTTSTRIFRKELLDFSTAMGCDLSDIVNEESLKNLTFQSILDEVEAHAPRLFNVLLEICRGRRQEGNRRSEKDSCVVLFISGLSYQVSQRNNRTQMFVCIYMRAKSAPKSLYTFYQHCGISLSHGWGLNAVKTVSLEAMEKAVDTFSKQACILVHDNLRFPFKVKHRGGDNISATDNGTAITMIPLPDEATAVLNDPSRFVDHRRRIKELYLSQNMRFLQPSDFHLPQQDALVNRRLKYNMIAALFRIPQLAELNLELEGHELLKPPPPIDQLPCGDQHRSKQFMLGTLDVEEASLSGNNTVIHETLKQLGIETNKQRQQLAASRLQIWVGDQLTVERGHGLTEIKQDDLNTFDRQDWIVWVPGWFHILMNLARSIYYIDFGTSTGLLLARDVATLGRSGLKTPTKQKGPAFHTLDEALHHILEARYRGLWIWATGVDNTQQLVEWVQKATPQDILEAANRIWSLRASNRALTTLDQQKSKTTTNEDLALESNIRLTSHLMLYEECRRSVRTGDVGLMELLLPRLLMFFAGAGNPKYAREMANMLQWQWHEAPPGLSDIIRRHAWIVNFNGKPDGFYAIDLRQELNNLSLRLHGPPAQSSSWEQYKQISPAMPVLSAVVDQFDRRFSDFHRSRKHYVPDAENDISRLLSRHATARIHDFVASRDCSSANTNLDAMEEGQQLVLYSDYLVDYAAQRQKYYGSTNTLEIYEDKNLDLETVVQAIKNTHMDPLAIIEPETTQDIGTQEIDHVTGAPTNSPPLSTTSGHPEANTNDQDEQSNDDQDGIDFLSQGVVELDAGLDEIASALEHLYIDIL
ncbi:hypothetical protein BDV93DRAFT_569883 [Ceratobasidium sp. AG-I]|nr:hypothetical protein BDV93DRAFT_569883 [Ceratobasidium sp. AG-I]